MFSFQHKNKVAWLSVISTLSIVALLCVQFYWLYNNYKSTYAKLVDDVREALQDACDKEQNLQKEVAMKTFSNKPDKDTAQTSYSLNYVADTIKKMAATSVTLVHKEAITQFVNFDRLDSLFRAALVEKGLVLKYALESTRVDGSKQTKGERGKRPEIVVEVPLKTMHTISVNNAEPFNIININKEDIKAYVPFTPFVVFRKMLLILIISALLSFVIIYCLASQLLMIRQQKTAAEMKNDFIANFTHELKTPIAVVYAALDNIERNPEQSETAVEMGKAQLKRLSDSVEKILSLSVEEQRSLVLHYEDVDLAEWLASLVAPFRLKTDKNIEFELLLTPPNCKATIDKLHFANALNNIIDNAIKYSGEKVQVTITGTRTDQGLRITISDNGFGIAADDLKKIFMRFYRAKTTSDKVKGFGLGLNYAKTIIELHGGSIAVESLLGKGSTFIIDIPQRD